MVTTQDVAQLQRHSFRPEEVGLTLAEAKQLLGSVQRVMVQEHLSEYITEQTHCRECGQTLARKGQMVTKTSWARMATGVDAENKYPSIVFSR